MPPVKSLGNSRAQYNYKFGLTGFEAADPHVPLLVYSDDVFSTYLYEGINNNLTIQNDIDLASKGGIIWDKDRDNVRDSRIVDVQSNALLSTSLPNSKLNGSVDISSYITYNSNGWTSPNENSGQNTNGNSHVSWTFRKQPGFFTIKNWTGDGQGDRYLDHDLESVPGFVMVKNLTDSQDWGCYHRSLGTLIRNGLTLNQNYESGNANIINPIRTTPTASQIEIRGAAGEYNTLNKNYVAYIFAHDDQRFGTDKGESIIKCDTWTSSSGEATVNLGWEPQFVLTKNVTTTGVWQIFDTMRGMPVGDTDPYLSANSGGDEQSTNNFIDPLPNGFKVNNMGATQTFAYIAIRRPHKPITVPTKLFTVGGNTSSEPEYVSNFVVDMAFHRNLGTNVADDPAVFSRLTGSKALTTNSTLNETTPNSINQFDFMDGWGDNQANNSNYKSWMFRRAPGFFDAVAYSSVTTTTYADIPHNLGVQPELVIIKGRDTSTSWHVWSTALSKVGYLNIDGHFESDNQTLASSMFYNTDPTATTFRVGTSGGTNQQGTNSNYIAYLFASLPGVSKVGTFEGNSSTKDIDCGFSNGARFVMIKRAAGGGTSGNHWTIWDKTRGIVAGDDPYFLLNDDAAEVTDTDYIDHLDAGFRLTSTAPSHINGLGNDFIFLAIA